MHPPSLNALRAFHATARLGSLSAAADELSVTTSAVSRQIKNLEECTGVALIARHGRGIRLTEDGKTLSMELTEAFCRIDEAVEKLRRPLRGERLRITVPPIFASTWLIPRLERFNALRPKTEIVLVDSREKVGVSSRNQLVIDWGTFQDDAMTIAIRLSDGEEIFPVCSPDACPGPGLVGATLLRREVDGNSWNWPDWESFLAAVGLAGVDCKSGPALTARLLLEASRQGNGVILSNTTIAREDLATGRLVRPVPEYLSVDDAYWLLMDRSLRRRPEVMAFVDWLKKEFASGSHGAL